ncbi:phosphatase PAP2 family protein [Kineosporia babensis]|uniref:Phosphatase PAP2 family protein n=1 Tax=Kineosporia babensis TaxID=499548 RepID=A0A9X1NIF3_9ACTN|nr:phosphatase PAP2 family protein [Kineosporia babensis]MCD5314164.1 phosphatase PAP2 family protein [Kineosporia babensis]
MTSNSQDDDHHGQMSPARNPHPAGLPAEPASQPDDLAGDDPSDHEGRLVLAGVLLFLGTALLGGFVLVMVLVATGLPGVPEIDNEVATGLHGYVVDRSWLEHTLKVLGHATEPFVLRAVFLIPAFILWRHGARRAVAWMVATLAVGGVLNALIKLLVDRARPDLPEPIYLAAGASFPSGHTTNAVLFAGIVVVLLDPSLRHHLRLPADGHALHRLGARIALWAGAFGFVLLVALDRLGLGVHYLTDVVGGFAFGLSILMITLVAFSRSSTLKLWPRKQVPTN